jgi:uncharacterized protein
MVGTAAQLRAALLTGRRLRLLRPPAAVAARTTAPAAPLRAASTTGASAPAPLRTGAAAASAAPAPPRAGSGARPAVVASFSTPRVVTAMAESDWVVNPAAAIVSTEFAPPSPSPAARRVSARPADADLVFYHGSGCPDGFAAAFAAWKARGDAAMYVPMSHGGAQPGPADVAGRHVVVVDYCFPRAATEALAAAAASFVVLDHHASAARDLEGWDPSRAVFEMRQSGATLAWNYFHPGTAVPRFLRYVEDKDIWRWALRDSEAFTAGYGTVEQTFAALDGLLRAGDGGVLDVIAAGRPIVEYKTRVRDSHVGRAVPAALKAAPHLRAYIVNATTLASEIGNGVCLKYPDAAYAAVWSYDHDTRGVYVSLRSATDDVDVSVIAKAMGGGGHKRAAGFSARVGSIEDLLAPPPPAPAEGDAGAAAAAAGGGAPQ